MEGIIKDSFGVCLKIMKIFRLYPPGKPTRLYRVQAFVLYFTFIIFVPFLVILYFILEENRNEDILQANYTASFLGQTTCFTVKLLPFLTNSQQIRMCINYFKRPEFKIYETEDTKTVENCIRICRRNCMTFVTTIAGGTICWIIKPFFLKGYNLPLDVWLPFNPTKEPKMFYSLYIFLSIGLTYAALAGTIIDPLIGGLACHTASQLKILRFRLENLTIHDQYNEIVQFELIYSKIKKCIIHHNAILDFTRMYEECFSLSVFSQFVASVFVICFCCLQLREIPLLSLNGISSIIYMIIILIQVYFYCYYGTLIIEENHHLANAIYMSNWYEYDIKSKKALIILMEKSTKPLIINAGKIFNLSLEMFTLILKRSYSLLAVLQNYQQNS